MRKNVILKIKGTCPCFLTLHMSGLSSYDCFAIQDLADTLISSPCGLPALDAHEAQAPTVSWYPDFPPFLSVPFQSWKSSPSSAILSCGSVFHGPSKCHSLGSYPAQHTQAIASAPVSLVSHQQVPHLYIQFRTLP